jgi:hypothetical protein
MLYFITVRRYNQNYTTKRFKSYSYVLFCKEHYYYTNNKFTFKRGKYYVYDKKTEWWIEL